jgi:hypothetical protein
MTHKNGFLLQAARPSRYAARPSKSERKIRSAMQDLLLALKRECEYAARDYTGAYRSLGR